MIHMSTYTLNIDCTQSNVVKYIWGLICACSGRCKPVQATKAYDSFCIFICLSVCKHIIVNSRHVDIVSIPILSKTGFIMLQIVL